VGRLSDAGSKKKGQGGFHLTTLACGRGPHAHRFSPFAQPKRHVAQVMAHARHSQHIRHGAAVV
jgi:hypothetical protein